MDGSFGPCSGAGATWQLRRQSKTEALGIIRELEGGAAGDAEQAAPEEEIAAARARLRKK